MEDARHSTFWRSFGYLTDVLNSYLCGIELKSSFHHGLAIFSELVIFSVTCWRNNMVTLGATPSDTFSKFIYIYICMSIFLV